VPVASTAEAELAKLLENTSRHVNIGSAMGRRHANTVPLWVERAKRSSAGGVVRRP
jgi:UDP-N-acetyl-D-mannosaminuronate dehydrogenase